MSDGGRGGREEANARGDWRRRKGRRMGWWEALLRLGKFAVLRGVLGAQLSAVSWEPLLCPLQLP